MTRSTSRSSSPATSSPSSSSNSSGPASAHDVSVCGSPVQIHHGPKLMRPRRRCNGADQRISEFISKIGNSIAKTMPMTNRPMPTISSGPEQADQGGRSGPPAPVPGSGRRAPASLPARRWTRRWRSGGWSSAGTGGWRPASGRSARLRARARLPSATASRIGRLVTTSPAMRSASSTGTALAVRMLSVRVKRAVLKPRSSLPTSGSAQQRSGARAAASPGCCCQRQNRTPASASASSSQMP